MPYKEIDETRLTQMYLDGDTIRNMEIEFRTTSATIYRRLKANGIESNRKIDIPWKDEEDELLIDLKNRGLTGSDVYGAFENRIPTSVKSRVQKLRLAKRIR